MNDNQSKPLMLMFTIGPAQSFIEAARKTEDLWMGSYILSYLIATAIEQVQGDGVEIIYPAIREQSPFEFWEKKQDLTTPSFPNLFLAIGDGISRDALVNRTKCAEDHVETKFKQMAKCAVDAAFSNWRKTYVECVFNRQVSDFFDVYWVITEETGKNYGNWYAHTASSLAAVKNCRTFKQTSEFGRKCSLDGTREILHKRVKGLNEREQIENAMDWWEKFAEDKPQFCRPKEALCAVSLAKRMGRYYLRTQSVFKDEFDKRFSSGSLSFPSTSEVATANFKERISQNPDALGVYAEFCKAVKELRQSDDEGDGIPTVQPLPKIKCPLPNNVDGEWLYQETWDPSYLKRYYNVDASKATGQIEQCKRLRRDLIGLLGGEPGKYYAAIALDADNMGAVNRNAKSQAQHAERSTKLIKYTETARQIVERDYLGKLTYAGGDDLLALANLEDLLPILKKLRRKFPKFTTASVGVCIAHNKMPLGDVLRHARRMEAAAKLKYGKDKNAFGVALFKRSGNVSEVVTKWKYSDLDVLTVGRKLIKLLQDDEISKRFLYTFRDAFSKLIGNDEERLKASLLPLLQEEFKRLIERAYKKKGEQLGIEQQETIAETIVLLSRISPFTDYLSFLEMINFITRESK